MPKIIDHTAHRTELAQKAAAYFSENGYGGASMRRIADHLGVSKSGLYHYFPSKEALFLAATEQVMRKVDSDHTVGAAPQEEQIQELMTAMRPDFGPEMALLFDYLRGKSATEIADDAAMQLALTTYRRSVTAIVGEAEADATLAKILGTLLLEYLTGDTGTPKSVILAQSSIQT
ncbi:MAG: TetR/AcrR family transcriptional regulator [Labrenzia sp.]